MNRDQYDLYKRHVHKSMNRRITMFYYTIKHNDHMFPYICLLSHKYNRLHYKDLFTIIKYVKL